MTSWIGLGNSWILSRQRMLPFLDLEGGERDDFENCHLYLFLEMLDIVVTLLGIRNQPREMPNWFHVEEIVVSEPRVHSFKSQSCTV